MSVIGYIGVIIGANVAITTFGLVPVGFGLMAPAGVYFAGLAFTLRDAVRETIGVRWSIAAIVIGAVVSGVLTGPALGLASGVAFLVSELLDAAVYEPLRRRGWIVAVAASNIAGLMADSALFLWLAFGSLDFLPGQIVGKTWMTVLAIVVIAMWRRR